ncbi:ABC transporter permease [Acidobacteriota bacterium]
MMKFLFKGIFRDRSRSLFPFLVVSAGVMLTVLLYCWIMGVTSDMIRAAANFDTGHVKIMTQAYAKEADQMPNDLAFLGVDGLLKELREDFLDFTWAPRIKFGGLLDIPDEQGETRSQGPVVGLAVDMFSQSSPEWDILNLEKAVVRGRLPEKSGEILISDDFAHQLNVELGEIATLISSTMYGSMASANFVVVGTVRFGMMAMDRGSMIADVTDIQFALDMEDGTGEILGFSNDFIYREERAEEISVEFNSLYQKKEDEFTPVMKSLQNQGGFAELLKFMEPIMGGIIIVFVGIMAIVLWNAGLMGSLRRYGEIGVRLAIGESKGHLYRSLIAESVMIGFLGSILGTTLGLAFAYYLQTVGFDTGSMMKNATLLMSSVMRARITPASFIIGFVPGVLATVLGTSISGISIYKRQTSQLMKELEV